MPQRQVAGHTEEEDVSISSRMEHVLVGLVARVLLTTNLFRLKADPPEPLRATVPSLKLPTSVLRFTYSLHDLRVQISVVLSQAK